MELAIGLAAGALALALVALPLLRRAGEPNAEDDAALDRLVDAAARSLDAGTACARCLAANPPGSSHCAACGAGLEGG